MWDLGGQVGGGNGSNQQRAQDIEQLHTAAHASPALPSLDGLRLPVAQFPPLHW
jgi:hypothetical protein